jgi:hypothetical protein
MKNNKEILSVITILILFWNISCVEAFSQSTLHVPSIYPTIQEALNASGTMDTIEIEPGVYPEHLSITKKSVFKGEGVTISGDSIIVGSGKNLLLKGNFTVSGHLNLLTGENGTATYFCQGNLILQNPVTFNKRILYQSSILASFPIKNALAEILMGYYLSYFDESANQYIFITDPDTVLNPVAGYHIASNSPDDTVITFIGEPFSDAVLCELQCTGLLAEGNGWNLLGNPYTSFINWDNFDKPAGMGYAIYLCDANGKYVFYVNGIGSTSPLISSLSGFFVRYTDSSQAASVSFSPEYCTLADPGYPINQKDDLLGLSVHGNGLSDETFIYFNDYATPGFNLQYDALKINPEPNNSIIIYSKNNDYFNYSVNARPEVNSVKVIVDSDIAGNYVIQADLTSEFNHLNLEDLSSGTITDLLTDTYEFEVGAYDEPRYFMMHFTAVGTVDPNSSVYVYGFQQKIYINILDESKTYYASIRDIFGKEVLAQREIPAGITAIEAEPEKCYVVNVKSDGFDKTYNIFTYVHTPENGNSFTLFPNPFNGKVSILSDDLRNVDISITVLDNSGKVLKILKSVKPNQSFDPGKLHPGIYYFEIMDQNSNIIQIEKMIKL